MKIVAAILLGLGLVGILNAADESQEPERHYALHIDGRRHALTLDNAIELDGTYTNPEVVLRASATRTFTYAGLVFKYPASFSWDAQIIGPDHKVWTMASPNVRIIIIRLPIVMTPEEQAAQLVREFSQGNPRITDVSRYFSGRTLRGKRVSVQLASEHFNLDTYALPTKTGSRLIILHDQPPAGKPISGEGERAFRDFFKTLKDTEGPK
ncbi:hypothetical protein [Acanthopleuribacter pedis]|uniref:Uncharacterized protein n=1 Tax=Acanthopleuribacter pedis TaxID=442870 RepID=A0A8J7U3D7_9BACT|nr:hypothetical protein [Acanthopleuribacter pedis]MBO1317352.1 hypothetical protein [Acanthopleuribacter pedis]MBO1318659.1 hypothetical protein [Acanthopleuribacter pedis]